MHLVNALITALNYAEKLPRIIMVLLDWDLVKYIGLDHTRTEIIFSEILDWIINNMKQVVQSKRDYLMRKGEGAVTDNDPKIIWIKMINRFSDGHFKRNDPTLRALSQKGKFNCVLEDRLAAEQAHYIMDVNVVVNDGKYFNVSYQLNGDGRVAYWSEVNEQVQLFNFKRITLKPLRKIDAGITKFVSPSYRHFDHHQVQSRAQHNNFHLNLNNSASHGTKERGQSNWNTYHRRY